MMFHVNLRRKPVERAEQGGVISFHDDSGGEDQRESYSLWVQFEGVSDGHCVLPIGGGFGVGILVRKVRVCNAHFADMLVVNTEDIVMSILDRYDRGPSSVFSHSGQRFEFTSFVIDIEKKNSFLWKP